MKTQPSIDRIIKKKNQYSKWAKRNTILLKPSIKKDFIFLKDRFGPNLISKIGNFYEILKLFKPSFRSTVNEHFLHLDLNYFSFIILISDL